MDLAAKPETEKARDRMESLSEQLADLCDLEVDDEENWVEVLSAWVHKRLPWSAYRIVDAAYTTQTA